MKRSLVVGEDGAPALMDIRWYHPRLASVCSSLHNSEDGGTIPCKLKPRVLSVWLVSEEESEVLNPFLASVFNSEISCSLGAQPPELADRDRESNEAP